MTERLRLPELNIHDVRMFAQTFIPRWDGYPLQIANGTYIQVKNPLALSHILKHLTNPHHGLPPLTIGAYALDANSHAKWVCLDADGDEQWGKLKGLAHRLHSQGIVPYLEPSRRGGHLWLFTPSLSGGIIRQFAKNLLIWGDIEPDKQIEIYPKQEKLKDGMGSFVRLPFGVHLKTGKVYHFVNIDGNPERIPTSFIREIISIKEDKPTPPPKFKKHVIFSSASLSESLKSAISVFDFVSKYVSLDAQGRGLCPFHDDHIRSFGVNIQQNYWSCFAGCGGGSIIDFWMKWRESHGQSGDFTETIIELREMLLVY